MFIRLNVDGMEMHLNPNAISHIWQEQTSHDVVYASIITNNGLILPGGVTAEEFDYFHELIAHQEIARIATPGLCDGLGAGFVIIF